MIPITAQQLPFHLCIPGVRVQLVEQTEGFAMKIHHSGITHILHAQRQHVRLFISLTRAAAFLNRQNIHIFSVATSGATLGAIEDDLVREFGATTTSTSSIRGKSVSHQTKSMVTILENPPSVFDDDDLEDQLLQELEDYKNSL